MNVWLHSDGTRDFSYMPRPELSGQANSIYLYDPERPFHYGLYDKAQPSCGTWLDLYDQYPSRTPMRSIDRDGQYFYDGRLYKNHDSILKHIMRFNSRMYM